MDLGLTESQQMIKDTVRRFMERECTSAKLAELDSSATGFPADIWKSLGDLGMIGLGVPEQYGGAGGSFTDLGVLYHELGRACAPIPHFSSAVLGAQIILDAGSNAQKSELLPKIASGELIVAVAITEPDFSMKAAQIQASATRDGSSYVLKGAKLFVPDAQVSNKMIVAARTAAAAEKGVSLFIVDSKAAGVSIRNLEGFISSCRLNEVVLDNVKVAESAVVGKVNGGWQALEEAIARSLPVLCSYMVGGSEYVFEMTRDYAGTRVQFGSPIGTFQRVQDHIIELVNAMDAARWTTAEALWKVDANKEDWKTSSSLAKAVASDGFHQATFQAHEVMAGAGSIREHPLHFYTAAARTLYWYLGDPGFHRKKIADLLEL